MGRASFGEGRQLDDRELVIAAQGGDVHAYEQLVRRYQGLAFRTAFFLTRSATDAEDAVQEGFVRAYRALGRFDPERPFRPWVLAIVANQARNQRRSAGRRERLALRAAAAEPHTAPDHPETDALAADRRRRLLDAVEHLARRDREVVTCRYLLDLSVAETAEVLGVAEGTVKSRLSRALDRLRAEIGGDL